WLGLTRLFYANNDKQHIIAATTRLNDSYFNQKNGTYNTKNARRHTVCHELGHTVGLEHVNTRSCLNDSERAIQDNVKPIKKDFKTLAKLYKHKDKGKSTIGAASTGARSVQSIDFIEIEAPTRQTSITSFLPDGTRVVTIVTWADE
ncbi:MAG: hypothetical protein IT337_14220, partial [Thermomicrobiales bacterium]|nr:hypothetical protein [Thermomicrobiales bacterium]